MLSYLLISARTHNIEVIMINLESVKISRIRGESLAHSYSEWILYFEVSM